MIHYQYRHDRARKTLRGIDEQVAKAQRAVGGHARSNATATSSSPAPPRPSIARWRPRPAPSQDGRATPPTWSISPPRSSSTPTTSCGASRRPSECPRTDLQARPIYHRTRDSIEAHLTVVFAAMAVSHWIEHRTGWSIKKFVRTARRYRTVQIRAGQQTLTAADPLPNDLAEALAKISTDGMRRVCAQLGSSPSPDWGGDSLLPVALRPTPG